MQDCKCSLVVKWCQTKARYYNNIANVLQFVCKYISRHLVSNNYTMIDQVPKENP